jgi:hypothetical protein
MLLVCAVIHAFFDDAAQIAYRLFDNPEQLICPRISPNRPPAGLRGSFVFISTISFAKQDLQERNLRWPVSQNLVPTVALRSSNCWW